MYTDQLRQYQKILFVCSKSAAALDIKVLYDALCNKALLIIVFVFLSSTFLL